VAGVIASSCLALSVAACGSSSESISVGLIPAAANAGAWNWTATCPYSPVGPGGCAAENPNLGYAQLDGNAWNLGGGPSTTGSVQMSVGPGGGLAVRGALPSAPPCTASTCLAPAANTWVRGYPNVLYGIDQCHAGTSPPGSSRVPLPIQVSAIPPELIATASYSSQAQEVTYDVAYDLWLENSATASPCKGDGALEVMVWTDYDEQALLPDSLRIGTATVPFAVNGGASAGRDAWSVYATNLYGGGHTVPWGGTVWVVLNRGQSVRQGTVSVDLSAALLAVGSLLEAKFGWTDFRSSYWLDSIPFGMEYGPQSASLAGTGSSNFTFDLSQYCLRLVAKVSEAAC
jgi:hypothetical protein